VADEPFWPPLSADLSPILDVLVLSIWCARRFRLSLRVRCSSPFHFQVVLWVTIGFQFRLFVLVFGCLCILVCAIWFYVVYLLGLAIMASVAPSPAGSNNRTFAQAVTITCNIQQNQLPKPAIKGDSLCIKISQVEYEKGYKDCKHNLRGRLYLSKGDKPISASNLHEKLLVLWKPNGNWKIIPLGKGFFDFEFSSIEDLKKIWAAGSWNLKPGILRLSKWSPDFSIRNHKQTHVQVWIRLIDLPQEYWRHTTLFEIANGVETPIALDNATKNRTFGHYARILVDLDLSKRIFNEIMVKREGFSFYVEIQYEWFPDY